MERATRSRQVVRFGVFELDLRAGELRKQGVRVKLQGQPFQILEMLLEQPGEVVTREELQQKIWADGSFVDYEQGLNVAIKKLRLALGDSADSPRFIETLARRGYRFIAPVEGAGDKSKVQEVSTAPDVSEARATLAEGDQRAVGRKWKVSYWLWVTALLVLMTGLAAWFDVARSGSKPPASPLRIVPLTSYPGFELSPSFSPDGNQVAFSSNGEKQDNFDIYIKLIDSSTPVRLTTDPAEDLSPAFSPDGRSIGFIRVWKDHAAFIIIPSIGGPERVVADIAVPGRLTGMRVFSWLPDGKWVVVEGLALLSTESGEQRNLTSPPMKECPDYSPAVSPDGHTVAFARNPAGARDSSIYLLDLTEDLKPKGEPRRLSFVKGNSHVPTWMPNGKEIVFASGSEGGISLWKIPVSGREPELLSFSGSPDCPTISRSGNQLAYQENRLKSYSYIRRLPLSSPGVASGPATRFISTRQDGAPQFSPDGKKIVFSSGRSSRSEGYEIWVCNSDGSSTMQLTSLAAESGTPRWSPNGERIAFDSNVEGQWEVYVVSANGGRPQRLTTNPAMDDAPSWSRDGKWIYFDSNRSGEHQVWKMPSNGGDAVQVTRNGGYSGFESSDGKWLYYAKGFDATSLWRVPVQGGEETQVVESLSYYGNFAVLDKGIYWTPRPDTAGGGAIEFLDLATGKIKPVARLDKPAELGLTVSPDGRWILYGQFEDQGSNIMLVENFH